MIQESDQIIIQNFSDAIEKTGIDSWLNLLIGLGPIIVGIVAVILPFLLNRRSFYQKERELRQDFKLRIRELDDAYKLKEKDFQEKIRESERQEIYKKLNEFYGPLLMLRYTSNKLHNTFKNGKKFRTVDQLIKGETYIGNDLALLKEIIEIGKACKQIILDKAGLIDEPILIENYIPKLLNHITIIQKAFDKKIIGEAERFSDYVFPDEIDDVLLNKIRTLQKRLLELSTIN